MTSHRISLRVKSGTGHCVLSDLTLESTVGDLRRQVSSLMQIPLGTLRLLHGFPPKPIDTDDTSKSLSGLNFRSGDTVIAQEEANTTSSQLICPPSLPPSLPQTLPTYPTAPRSQALLTRMTVAANNSCLFTSVHYALTGGRLDLLAAQPLRERIANVVSSDPIKYTEAFLGRSNAEYCVWIRHSDSWGGAIEVSILSVYHQIEIDVVDTQSLYISRFGEDHNYAERILLIYDGIHYDPLQLQEFDSSAPPVTRFPTTDDSVLREALELAREAKTSRQFTDITNLSLRCITCNTGLAGQVDAQKHAKETGHTNFGEI